MALDPRLKQQLSPWPKAGPDAGPDAAPDAAPDAVLVGVPFDHGVKLNNGRPGAANGPEALRTALRRFGTSYDVENGIDFSTLSLGDAGDVDVVPENVDATHVSVTNKVRSVLDAGAVPLVIGGGNDATFASVRALTEYAARELTPATGGVGGVNVDAHFDVREVIDGRVTSGTPFRKILDELGVRGKHFVELGAHAHVNSKAHHDYLVEQGASVFPLGRLRAAGVRHVIESELARLARETSISFVSIDLDVFSASDAPGVSAPGTHGLDPEEGRALAFAAGASPTVRLFELMELNPRFDIDERTARLAAMLLCSFLAGLATRSSRTKITAP
jgi:formiminoglutamase